MLIFIYVLSGLLVLVCLLLVGSVLMQLPRNEGLGTAFGAGMTENLFGAETANVLTKITVWLGIIFFALTLTLAVVYSYYHQGTSAVDRELLASPLVEQPATPATDEGTSAEEKPADTEKQSEATEQPAAEMAPTATPAEESAAEQPAAAEENAQPAEEAAPAPVATEDAQPAAEAAATPAANE